PHTSPSLPTRRSSALLPKPAAYRLLADFDPSGATPQLAARTFSTAGYVAPLESGIAHPLPDLTPKKCANLTIELSTDPAEPLARSEEHTSELQSLRHL